MQDHRQLDVWHRAIDCTVRIHECSADLPQEEPYDLARQLRRAAVSVPLNIAEGAGSASGAEVARFLGYVYRSLKEVDTCLELSRRLYHMLPEHAAVPGVLEEANQIARMIRVIALRLSPEQG